MKMWSKKAQNKDVCVVTATQSPRNNEYFVPSPIATDIGTPDMIFVDYIGCMGY